MKKQKELWEEEFLLAREFIMLTGTAPTTRIVISLFAPLSHTISFYISAFEHLKPAETQIGADAYSASNMTIQRICY